MAKIIDQRKGRISPKLTCAYRERGASLGLSSDAGRGMALQSSGHWEQEEHEEQGVGRGKISGIEKSC